LICTHFVERATHKKVRLTLRKNLFVTGRPGVGKTTLIRSVLTELEVNAGGFCTVEVRDGGRRTGFDIVTMDGERGVLARRDLVSPHRVSRYGVDKSDLERVGVPAIERAVATSELIVMDEIGRMELCSDAFMRAVRAALDSPVPVIGTIQAHRNTFLDAVRDRRDIRVITVTEFNREDLVETLVDAARALIEKAAAGRKAERSASGPPRSEEPDSPPATEDDLA